MISVSRFFRLRLVGTLDNLNMTFHFASGAQQAELRSWLGAFVASSFGSLLLLSPRWTTEGALAPTLLAFAGVDGVETVAWPLVVAATVCAIRLDGSRVQM